MKYKKSIKNNYIKVLKSIKNRKLFIIFLVALSIRLFGITHNLPIVFNVDEPALINTAKEVRHNIRISRFDWPHLHFYTNTFLFFIALKFRDVIELIGLIEFIPLIKNDEALLYATSRIFNAFLGAFTIYPMYYATRKIFELSNTKNFKIEIKSKWIYLAPLIYALIPFNVKESHIATLEKSQQNLIFY